MTCKKFVLKNIPYDIKLQELVEWVKNNCQGKCHWHEINIYGEVDGIAFELETDALLYEMTWG